MSSLPSTPSTPPPKCLFAKILCNRKIHRAQEPRHNHEYLVVQVSCVIRLRYIRLTHFSPLAQSCSTRFQCATKATSKISCSAASVVSFRLRHIGSPKCHRLSARATRTNTNTHVTLHCSSVLARQCMFIFLAPPMCVYISSLRRRCKRKRYIFCIAEMIRNFRFVYPTFHAPNELKAHNEMNVPNTH